MSKGTIYILTNEAFSGLIKIGKTSKPIKDRMKSLNTTGLPAPFTCHYSVELDNYENVEKALHFAFQDKRYKENREFFKIDPEQVVAIIKLLEPKGSNATIELTIDKDGKEISLEENTESNKANKTNFKDLGINIGAILVFSRDENIKCEVGENNEVIYENKAYPVTTLVKKLLNTTKSLNGFKYLKYEEETIYSRKKRLEEENY